MLTRDYNFAWRISTFALSWILNSHSFNYASFYASCAGGHLSMATTPGSSGISEGLGTRRHSFESTCKELGVDLSVDSVKAIVLKAPIAAGKTQSCV
jgi:hypothetical protein